MVLRVKGFGSRTDELGFKIILFKYRILPAFGSFSIIDNNLHYIILIYSIIRICKMYIFTLSILCSVSIVQSSIKIFIYSLTINENTFTDIKHSIMA
jgi:hypothetical protein